jgi:hypothetical protein
MRDPRCDEWVTRVLGVTLGPRAQSAPGSSRRPVPNGFDVKDPMALLRKQIKACGDGLNALEKAAEEQHKQQESESERGPLLTTTIPSLREEYSTLAKRAEQPPSTDDEGVANALRKDLVAFGRKLGEARRPLNTFTLAEQEHEWRNRNDLVWPDDEDEKKDEEERKGEKEESEKEEVQEKETPTPDYRLKQMERLGRVEFIQDLLEDVLGKKDLAADLNNVCKTIQIDREYNPEKDLSKIMDPLHDDMRNAVAEQLKLLREAADRLSKYNAVNPGNDDYIRFQIEAADFLDNKPVDTDYALKLLDNVWTAQKNCSDLVVKPKNVNKILTEARQKVHTLPNPERRTGLLAKIDALPDTMRTQCAQAVDLSTLDDEWSKSEKSAKALVKEIRKAASEKLEPAIAKAEATQVIDAFGAFLEGLPGETGRKVAAETAKLFSESEPLPKEPSGLMSLIREKLKTAGDDSDQLSALSGQLSDALSKGFENILNGKDDGTIDKFVSALKGTVSGPTVQGCCIAALNKRFGVKISTGVSVKVERYGQSDFKKDENVVIKQLPQLYDILKRLPPKHLDENMKDIAYSFDPGMSRYFKSEGVTKPGRIQVMEAYHEDAPYLDLEDPGKTVKKQYFTMVTLHEIGHAVDDSNKVMGDNTAGDFGGWGKPDIRKVAEVLYEAHFKAFAKEGDNAKEQLLQIAQELLKSRKATVPEGKFDGISNSEGWKLALRIADSKTTPWSKPLLVDGDTAYHKSYDSDASWVSYSVAKRNSQAVSTYQYRAAGEWFAEIYAVFHAGTEAEQKKVRSKFSAAVIKAITAEA